MIAMEMMESKQNMAFVKSKIASVERLVYIISIFTRKKLRLVFKPMLAQQIIWLVERTNESEWKPFDSYLTIWTHLLGDKEADKFMDLIESWNENKPFVEASNACTRWKNVNEDKKVNDRLVEDRIQKCLYII